MGATDVHMDVSLVLFQTIKFHQKAKEPKETFYIYVVCLFLWDWVPPVNSSHFFFFFLLINIVLVGDYFKEARKLISCGPL